MKIDFKRKRKTWPSPPVAGILRFFVVSDFMQILFIWIAFYGFEFLVKS